KQILLQFNMSRDEWVRKSLIKGNALFGIVLEELAHKVFGIVGHCFGKLKVYPHYPFVGLPVPGLVLKGRRSHKKLVAQHSKAPHVHVPVVLFSLYHFRRQVVQRSTERQSTSV